MLPESELKDYILKNVNTYMRKSFAIFTDPTYRPDKKVMEGAVKYMSNLIKNNNDLRKAALGEFTGFKPEAAIKRYAESLTKKMLHEGKTNNGDPLAVLSRIVGAMVSINTGYSGDTSPISVPLLSFAFTLSRYL